MYLGNYTIRGGRI